LLISEAVTTSGGLTRAVRAIRTIIVVVVIAVVAAFYPRCPYLIG
jgi:hypothetical protein